MVLNYRQIGSGKQTVVLIHGLFGSLDNLQSLGKSLADEYCVILIDLRNHGDSPRSESMDLAELADDVLDTLTSAGFENFMVLGHSLGGKVAMTLALNYPQHVTGLMVADIAPVAYTEHRHRDVFKALNSVDLSEIQSRSQALDAIRPQLREPSVADFLVKGLRKSSNGTFEWRYNLSVLEAQYSAVADFTARDQQFFGPTLFIKGADSDYLTSQHSERVKQLFPNAQLKVVNGAGHWLHAQKPKVFNSLIRRFLEATTADDTGH